jgi:hypothetical protein
VTKKTTRREQGSALVVTVLLLVLLGVIGLAALDTVTRDQQVAGFQNRSRIAFYAAEAGVADAKNRLRQVWTVDQTVAFPDEATAVAIGDTGSFPFGRPVYYGDPSVPAAIRWAESGMPDCEGNDCRQGGSMRVNTLWQIRVAGRANDGATSLIEVMATRKLDGGGH